MLLSGFFVELWSAKRKKNKDHLEVPFHSYHCTCYCNVPVYIVDISVKLHLYVVFGVVEKLYIIICLIVYIWRCHEGIIWDPNNWFKPVTFCACLTLRYIFIYLFVVFYFEHCHSSEIVSEWLLFNSKWVIYQLTVYHGENKLHSIPTCFVSFS